AGPAGAELTWSVLGSRTRPWSIICAAPDQRFCNVMALSGPQSPDQPYQEDVSDAVSRAGSRVVPGGVPPLRERFAVGDPSRRAVRTRLRLLPGARGALGLRGHREDEADRQGH